MKLNLYNVRLKGSDKSREYFVRVKDFMEATSEAFVKAAASGDDLEVDKVEISEIGGKDA